MYIFNCHEEEIIGKHAGKINTFSFSLVIHMQLSWFVAWLYFDMQAMAGLAADGRQIVSRGRAEASNYQK